MITINKKGDFSKLDSYFNRLRSIFKDSDLDSYGRQGVEALSAATPYDTGNTAGSWYYKIIRQEGSISLVFYNSNVNKGVPIAVVLQYGHGTGTGGWVEGRDYINPAIQPIFDDILNNMQKEVCQ